MVRFRSAVNHNCSCISLDYSWKLESAPERPVGFIHSFNQDGAHRHKQACKEAFNTRGRTFEYTIRSSSDQKVAQQKTAHHACGRLFPSGTGHAVRQERDTAFEPVKIEDCDEASGDETHGYAPAIFDP